MPTNDVGYFTDLSPYTQSEIAAINAIITKDGYAYGVENELAVSAQTPAAMAVNVATGWIHVQGYWKHNPTVLAVSIDAAHATKNRIDRIVARVQPVVGTFTIEVLKGADYVGIPVAPTLTRTATDYMCSLAQVYVGAAVASINSGNITNERDDYTVCGAAAGQANVKANVLQTVTLPKLNGGVTGFTQAHLLTFGMDTDGVGVYLFGGGGSGAPVNFVSYFNLTAWANKTVMTTARVSLKSTYYSGNFYCIGGFIAPLSTPSKKNEAYNVAGDSWSSLLDKTTAVYDHGQCESNGIIYCFGGNIHASNGYSFIKTVEAYNIAGNTWAGLLDLPSLPVSPSIFCVADDTNTYIYIFYQDGANKFYRYDIGANTYTIRTAPTSPLMAIFYEDGAVYGQYNSGLYKYNITTDIWTTIIATTGMGSFKAVQLPDRRYIAPASGGTNTIYYTYYYYLGTATANSMAMFRSRSDINLQLMNITSGYAGEMVGLKLNDLYGIYVNLITVTDVGETVEIMG